MGKVLGRVGLAVFGLVCMAVALYTVSRLMPPPRAEADALALLDAPRERAGRNGFAALWAVAHDLPLERAQALLDEEARRLSLHSLPDAAHAPYANVLASYPLLVATDTAPAVSCNALMGGCLHAVRQDPAGFAAMREQRRALTARIAALDAYDYFANPLPPRPEAMMPSYQVLLQELDVHAHAFVAGDVDAGLEGACRSVSLGRRLAGSGDNLLASMVGAALVEGGSMLFVDMLAELPPERALPPTCQRAFPAEVSMASAICPTMLGEGHHIVDGMRLLNREQQRQDWRAAIFMDVEKTAARSAPRFAWYCGDEATVLVQADRPLRSPARDTSPWSLACVANAVGCILDGIAAPRLDGHARRLQDADMRLKLVATWLWLREHPDDPRPLAERLVARPDALKSLARAIGVSADGRLVAARHEARPQGGDGGLPIPEWMADAGRSR